mmetsp:Transcript_13995/g.18155  ORF Transcript_13995/g.18155 Transcript_13995/m.18155 type:complete len:87 (-) Transcript_13995:15-275(-)
MFRTIGATLGGLIGFGYGSMMFLSIVSRQQTQIDECSSNRLNESHDQEEQPFSVNILAWKAIAYSFLLWALVTGILGCIITTIKLL